MPDNCLGYPDRSHGMVSLTPEQQRTRVREHGEAFTEVKGKGGEQGATLVRLAGVDEEDLGDALTVAWQNAVASGPVRGRTTKGTTSVKAAKKIR